MTAQNELCDEEALPHLDPRLPFSTLITVTPSDVRIVTMVDRIFNGRAGCGTDLPGQLDDITKVMRFFYYEHGFVLQQLDEEISLPDDQLSIPVILDYLRQLSDLNRENAEIIYERVCNETLEIIRSVHQRGGHFGGGEFSVGEDKTVGIGWGGALAIRNFSLKGGINDFAECCFPWASLVLEMAQHAEKLQKFDLIYFAETEQWLRLVLFGAEFNSQALAEKHIFYPKHDLCLYSTDFNTPKILAAADLLDSSETAEEIRVMLFGG